MKPFKFSVDIRARLSETDAAGIVFHGSYYSYFDDARMEYLRHLGFATPLRPLGSLNVIVHACADFKSPARFGEVLAVHARISELGDTHFTCEFRAVRRTDDRVIADGKTIHVVLDEQTWKPIRVPEAFRKIVRAFEGPDCAETK